MVQLLYPGLVPDLFSSVLWHVFPLQLTLALIALLSTTYYNIYEKVMEDVKFCNSASLLAALSAIDRDTGKSLA